MAVSGPGPELRVKLASDEPGMVLELDDLHKFPVWREAAEKLDNGLAAGPDFWQRVQALGERHYYRPVDMAGMPTDGPPTV